MYIAYGMMVAIADEITAAFVLELRGKLCSLASRCWILRIFWLTSVIVACVCWYIGVASIMAPKYLKVLTCLMWVWSYW